MGAAASPMEKIQILGKYILLEKLGEGYLGSVFRGLDQDLGRAVAIRILCDGIRWDERVEELFHRECHAIAGLDHPNIAAIVDVGEQGQSRYIVMESLGNRNLLNLIAQKSVFTFEAKLSIMIQVAEGLSFAHKNGILHLALTPEKIHLTVEGSVKIRDFSIAHVLMKHLPHPIVRWGAPIYLSPEQIQQKICDVRSDIFSAGTIFYELLTGLHPFHDPNGNVALDNILLDAQIPTFERFPNAPPEIWGMLKTCLARDAGDRYKNMDELAAACRELVASVTEDTQLMLAELYASMTPLRKAAAQPNASEDVIQLLEEIQKLSRGEKEADYASLEQLMTILIDHYPSIRSAAKSSNPINLQIPVMGKKPTLECQNAPPPSEPKSKIEAEPQKPLAYAPPIISAENIAAEDKAECPAAARVTADSSPDEPQNPFMVSVVSQSAEKTATVERNDQEDPTQNPAKESTGIDVELLPDTKISIVSRYRKIRRPSYRVAVVLLSILVMAVAGYIVWNTEAAPIRNAWGLLLAHSPSSLKGNR
jgi:serine/threonine protein kinase